ncbi:hypothetical protein [Amycolatopsis alkalitolerans]|uniref:Uncharacterized protein n=1 Tax=Amycolatopsis alkalitolerans TaxID=2547244 RepID=A0A5C4M4H5_9PSEU|nr:hypothetical protein [Amycolatopsis alkalitolerans]TNC26169.1 hypothetical protein FG385_13510 [Amycolatopsis alkalitolerans]
MRGVETMAYAAIAMIALALGYLVTAVLCGRFRATNSPAEQEPGGAGEEADQAPGGTGSGTPGRL